MAGDAAGNYTVVRTFTATDDCGNSTSATQTITVEDTTAQSSRAFLPTTAECSDSSSWMQLQFDNCGEVTIEEVSETIAGDCAGNYTIAHLHCDGRRWQQHVCDSDHHGRGHDGSRVHERSCRLRRSARRVDLGRRFSV